MSGIAGIIAAVLTYQLVEGRWRWVYAAVAGVVTALVVYELVT